MSLVKSDWIYSKNKQSVSHVQVGYVNLPVLPYAIDNGWTFFA